MAYILLITDVCFELLSTSFENEGFDLLMTIGVDVRRKVFCIWLGEEWTERGCGAKVFVVVIAIDCSRLHVLPLRRHAR
jgi:hypothetical protein